jgi:hypothetical protein
MTDVVPRRAPPWKAWYRRIRLVVEVVGTLTMAGGFVLPAVFWPYDYRNSCQAKGQGLFICIGGSLGLVDVERLHQKDVLIETLRAELDRRKTETTIAASGPTLPTDTEPRDAAALAEANAALKKAKDELEQRDTQIAELSKKVTDLTGKYTDLSRSIWAREKVTSSSVRVTPSKVPRRPDANAFSTSIWASGTISHGETKQAKTAHGTLQCTGGNMNTGARRSCLWLP